MNNIKLNSEFLEEIGWKTVVTDTNSFVSRMQYSEDKWLELFYCKEKNFLQIMEATKGKKGEVLRHTKYEGDYVGMDFWTN